MSKLRFTHDAWNRLVKVEYEVFGGGFSVRQRGQYEYNGLTGGMTLEKTSRDSFQRPAFNIRDTLRLFFPFFAHTGTPLKPPRH